MDEKEKVVAQAYWQIAKRARYNQKVADAFIAECKYDNISASEMLKRSAQFVDISHLGDSLLFSLSLIEKLEKIAKSQRIIVSSYLVQSPSGNTVGYSNGEERRIIADITADIKKFTIAEGEAYNPNMRFFDVKNVTIPLTEYMSKNAWIELFPDIWSFNGDFFTDFLNSGTKI